MTRPLAALKLLLAAALLAWAVTACSGDGSSGRAPQVQGNLFVNPGLEDGESPWLEDTSGVNADPGVHFVRTEERAHSGRASALLRMRDPLEAEKAKVYYLVQEIKPGDFPEVLRGFYRVENWQKGTPKQYLQFVVIVFGPNPTTAPNWQIRYPLAGIKDPPFAIGNAKFDFITKEEPVQGQWVPFQTNIKEDFQRLWGQVPQDFDKIRVLFEVRWDDKVAGQGAPQADVYYDDLYIGRATSD